MNAAVEDELIDTNPVKVKAAAHAQVARERDPAPLPIPILFRVADAMPERLRLGVLLGGVLGMRSGEVRALQRRDFTLSQDMPTVTVSRAVKEAEGKLEIGTLKTARKGIASRTPVIPAALVDAVRDDRRDHTQIGRNGLLFWRAADGRPIRSADWLMTFKKACQQVAADLEAEAANTGQPETEESQRIRELLTDHGGYIFHGTRVTGLTGATGSPAATSKPSKPSADTPPPKPPCATNAPTSTTSPPSPPMSPTSSNTPPTRDCRATATAPGRDHEFGHRTGNTHRSSFRPRGPRPRSR